VTDDFDRAETLIRPCIETLVRRVNRRCPDVAFDTMAVMITHEMLKQCGGDVMNVMVSGSVAATTMAWASLDDETIGDVVAEARDLRDRAATAKQRLAYLRKRAQLRLIPTA
jgi:hypothetical protein